MSMEQAAVFDLNAWVLWQVMRPSDPGPCTFRNVIIKMEVGRKERSPTPIQEVH